MDHDNKNKNDNTDSIGHGSVHVIRPVFEVLLSLMFLEPADKSVFRSLREKEGC